MAVATEPAIRPLHSPGASDSRPSRGVLGSILSNPVAHAAGTVAVYTLLALQFIRAFAITDPDIWWHLATGRWILLHHAVPVTDPFSSYGMGKPWIAYSWFFDAGIQILFQHFSYVGIVLYEVAVRVALAAALFHLVRSLLPHFWRAAALTVASLYAMSSVIGPRPGMLTILFGIIELDILLSSRHTENKARVWLLPVMLVVWANWHIQFVYGLLILGVFAAESCVAFLLHPEFRGGHLSRIKQLSIVSCASVLATFVNPYGPRIYSTVLQYMHQPKSYNLISELKAMSFREPQHFIALFLVLGAAMAIGWRREASPLWPLLLSVAAIVAFRSAKEVWFLSVISACAIADHWTLPPLDIRRPLVSRERLLVLVSVLAVLAVAYSHYDVSNSWLEIQVDGNFPEVACQYIEKHHLAGPLYNHLNDGGFLIWRLPSLRVSMDGRTNVQGDERIAHFNAVWNGKPEWATDAELAGANVVLARREAPLTSLLRLDGRFRIVFEDVQAVVFQHN